MTAFTPIRRATAVAIALGLGSLGLAGAAQAEDATSALSTDSGSLEAFQAVIQTADVAEEIPGAEDMPVDRGVVLLPDHELNDEMYAGELGAVVQAKAFIQLGGSADIGSEAGDLR